MGTPTPMGILKGNQNGEPRMWRPQPQWGDPKRELKRETPTVGTPIPIGTPTPMGDPKRELKWGIRVGTLTPVWDPKGEPKWKPQKWGPQPQWGS